MSEAKFLETEKVSKLLFKFAIPGMVGLFVLSMYNICDRIFVGKGVGSIGLSAITMVYPVTIVRFATCLLIVAGTSALVSISFGEKDNKKAEKILGVGFLSGAILAILQTYFGVFHAEPILKFFGCTDKILPFAVTYMETVFLGAFFMFASFFFNFLIRTDGSPKISMYIMIASALSNIVLDYVFVFPLQMGIKGAAIATVISQFISFAWGSSYYLLGKSNLKIKLNNMRLDLSIIKNICMVGFPSFIRDFIWCLQNWYMNYQLVKYGDDIAVAAMGIVYGVLIFIFMPIVGVADGILPIVGYNFGAKRYDRVKETVLFAMKCATIVAIFNQAIVMLFPEFIASLFSKQGNELSEVASKGLFISFAGLFMAGVVTVLTNYLYCLKKVKMATFMIVAKKVAVFFVLLYFLPPIYKVSGVWLSLSGTEFIFFVVTLLILRYELKDLNRKILGAKK